MSNNSSSKRRNYTAINMNSATELEAQKQELKEIYSTEKYTIKLLKAIRSEKEKVEKRIKDLQDKLDLPKTRGGTRKRR